MLLLVSSISFVFEVAKKPSVYVYVGGLVLMDLVQVLVQVLPDVHVSIQDLSVVVDVFCYLEDGRLFFSSFPLQMFILFRHQ